MYYASSFVSGSTRLGASHVATDKKSDVNVPFHFMSRLSS